MPDLPLQGPLPVQMPGDPFRAPGLIPPPQHRYSRAAQVLAGGGGQAPLGGRGGALGSFGGLAPPSFAGSAGAAPGTAMASALLQAAAPQRQWSPKFGEFTSSPGLLGSLLASNGGAKANFAGDLLKPDPAAAGGFGSWFSGLFGGGGVKG